MLLAIVAVGASALSQIDRMPPICVVVSWLAGAIVVFLFVACGFYMLQPNQAAAITLFGSYKGTDRTTGCAGSCRG